jgi:trimethylamine:corrinoid methyltransferase-like protein
MERPGTENGAKVDNDTKIAEIPAESEAQALETAPKSFAGDVTGRLEDSMHKADDELKE